MDKNLHDLIQDIKNKRQTVMFLGSGVDYSPGKKLLWNDVLHEFIRNAIPLLNLPHSDVVELQNQLDPQYPAGRETSNDAAEFSTEGTVSVIKKLLGNDYVPLLQNIIYTQATRQEMRNGCADYIQSGASIKRTPFYTLFAIAEMIIRHDNIKAVVTYNYDNLLSQAIRLLQQHPEYFEDRENYPRLIKENFRPTDIYSGWTDEPFANASFPIYHPHGYIQPPGDLIPNERNQVVMSMEEFYDSAKDTFSWQHATQIHFLTHYMCMYLGASLTDMNMQRLLSFADIEHNNESIYYLTTKGGAMTKLKNIFHTNNHLRVVAMDDYQSLYAELLYSKNYE